ncbi:hypothetical protein BGX38DRAFT_262292 [Terfezia claveryi]|nr:hypothetical protein BGX38DRAFT_262292 [Terfezia claveryi]
MESTNWTNLITQLRRYAVNYGVQHQLVMDGTYALYIEFLDMDSDEDITSADVYIRYLIVEFCASTHGIWDTPPGINVLDQTSDIMLNARELVMFLVWNASTSISSSLGPPPTPTDLQAIHGRGSRKKGADGSPRVQKRTRSSYAGGGGFGEKGETSSTGGKETDKRGRYDGDHSRQKESGQKQGGGGDKSSQNIFPEEIEDGPPVSTTLPPVGTIFELVPAEPSIGDSGFWDHETYVDDTSDHNGSASGRNVAQEHALEADQPASSAADPLCLRASLARALYNVTNSAASSFVQNGQGLVAQISKLLTPHVALITLLSPTPGLDATAGTPRMIMKSFPYEGTGSADKGPLAAGLLPSQLPLPTELSADKGPLAAGLLPSQLPLPTELSAYKAFATVGAGLDYVNIPVPHYFGAWKYMPLRMPSFPDASPVTPQFTVLLVEDLSAPGLDGQTLLDYFYPVKQTRSDITVAERDLVYDAAKVSLEWLHTKAHVSHRDLNESNIMVLQNPVTVVLIDFDQAAVGERVLEGCGALIPTSRRRYWDAVKGWGKVDRIVLKEIFERVRIRGSGGVDSSSEDEEGNCEDSGEEE